jgi:adenosylmethionine-8-amino-7-oxononanoate aminotransferase
MPADTRLWHAFADMHAVRGNEFVIARGDGAYVWDEDGSRYLDGTASLWCVNVGHGRTEIVDAAMAQMRVLASYQTFGTFANRPALDLAERLADLAPLDDPRIFLGSGGGDAIDTAAKLARRYFAAIGTPERTHLISRSQGYHGTHGMGTSIGGIPANREDVGPLDPDASVVPHDSLEALEAEVERVGAERLVAGQLAHLRHRGLDDLVAPVADVDAPQARGAVQVAVAVLVPHVGAIATGDDELVAADGVHVGEGVPEAGVGGHGLHASPRLRHRQSPGRRNLRRGVRRHVATTWRCSTSAPRATRTSLTIVAGNSPCSMTPGTSARRSANARGSSKAPR